MVELKPELIVILGPTGVGKTDYSIEYAKSLASPIISCDSRQLFKEMKIGTAPPSKEQLAEVVHYFIGSHSINKFYTAGLYEIEAMELLSNLFKTHNKLVMTGGSGLYIDAVCRGLDDFPESDQQIRATLTERLKAEGLEPLRMELKELDIDSYRAIDIANPQRVIRALEVTMATGKKFSEYKSNSIKERPFNIRKIGINRARPELYDRINQRVDNMVEDGLVEEVRGLIAYKDMPALKTVGYKEIFDYFDGLHSLEEAIELIKRNSRRYAKRQLTYWGRDRDIEWINI